MLFRSRRSAADGSAGVAGNIVIAWILTIPASALVAAIAYVVISPFI